MHFVLWPSAYDYDSLYSGRNSMTSGIEQWSIMQSASSVLVDTDSPAFSLRIVELLIPPLICSVYVVAPVFCIVIQRGLYEINEYMPPFSIDIYPLLPIIKYKCDRQYCLYNSNKKTHNREWDFRRVSYSTIRFFVEFLQITYIFYFVPAYLSM